MINIKKIVLSVFLIVLGATVIGGSLWAYDVYPVQSYRLYQYFIVLGAMSSLYLLLTWLSSGQCFAVIAADLSVKTPVENLHKEFQEIIGRVAHMTPNVKKMRIMQVIGAGVVIGRNMIVHEVEPVIFTSAIIASLGLLFLSITSITQPGKLVAVTSPCVNEETVNATIYSHIKNNVVVNGLFSISFYMCFTGK